MTKRYILTGAPGAGKTVIIRYLEVLGHSVIEEAATDVIALEQAGGIAESWRDSDFTLRIARLQMMRAASAHRSPANVQFHDRSVFCTYALARFLGHAVPPELDRAVTEAVDRGTFERRVFFVRLLGFITRTEARRISLEDSIAFERVHEQVYREFGFELVDIRPASVAERTAAILAVLSDPEAERA